MDVDSSSDDSSSDDDSSSSDDLETEIERLVRELASRDAWDKRCGTSPAATGSRSRSFSFSALS